MKRFFFYLMALCLLSACFPELSETPDLPWLDAELEGKPVLVEFSVPDICVATPTKAAGDIGGEPYLDTSRFYLVACGHSQSIKYIRRVHFNKNKPFEMVDVSDIPNYPLEDQTGQVKVYHFTAELELSDSDRTLHFLANINENDLKTGSYAYDLLPTLTSEEGKQAFWQSVYLSKILPERDTLPDGSTVPVMENGFYKLDPAIADTLSYIPLIRNYATVQVADSTRNFELFSYAVIYEPKTGSVVPYRSNAAKEEKFVFKRPAGYQFSGYELCSYTELDSTLAYPGNLPASASLNDYIPPAEHFEHPELSNGRVIPYYGDERDKDLGVYIYERGAPTPLMGPTFIIIRGKFKDEDTYYYYRLDLTETKSVDDQAVARYYPLFRNFRYKIDLWNIGSEGVSSPEAAATSSGMEDISADYSMRHLSDISNGTTRLVVEPYMAQTFTGPKKNGYYELYVRFFDDVGSSTPNMQQGHVRVSLEPPEDGGEPILLLYDNSGNSVQSFYPEVVEMGGEPGFRKVRFNTVNPTFSETRTQKIKITGYRNGVQDKYTLYREVEISLQKLQTMELSCTPERLGVSKGSEVTLNIKIPSGLPESVFPLNFVIEPVNMTLTPDNAKEGNNLPVQSGTSLANDSKTAFQFVRTLTLSEYRQRTSGAYCTFPSYFKSNRREGGTEIFVENPYFEPASVMLDSPIPTNQFYVVAEEDCYVQINGSTLDYKVDDGAWTKYTANQAIQLAAGQKVSFNANSTATTDWRGKFFCYTTEGSSTQKNGKFKVGGNIASLIVGDDYEQKGPGLTKFSFKEFFRDHTGLSDASALELPMKTCTASCYQMMFYGCTSLTKAPVLPATTMATYCYESMFYNCQALASAPVLPATTMATYCYKNMFRGCKALVTSPSLPAQTLATQCYYGMFNSCIALSSAPELPATTLAESCYWGMFYNCTALSSAPATLPAMTLANNCYKEMFKGCTNLTAGPALPVTTLANNCYEGMFQGCTNLASAPELPATVMAPYCYKYIFRGCKALTSAPDLPATTLAKHCYEGMFYSCTALAEAPDLPAMVLENNCYQEMFRSCTSLQTVSNLPATTVADSCYFNMFRSCTGLTTADFELPATTLSQDCYREMFRQCSNLTTAPVFCAPTLVTRCYQQMLSGCKKLKTVTCLATDISATDCTANWLSESVPNDNKCTFYKASAMTVGDAGGWQRNVSGIPSNWVVKNYGE